MNYLYISNNSGYEVVVDNLKTNEKDIISFDNNKTKCNIKNGNYIFVMLGYNNGKKRFVDFEWYAIDGYKGGHELYDLPSHYDSKYGSLDENCGIDVILK
ncbi:MAG: hypothetical protein LBR36_08235 [Bacteroidales bacterium]|jgi:hypothetical protein|nr:hypothetical protein [Bacteroidales bacterium]